MCSRKHSKANNKYCPDYDKAKPEKRIVYLELFMAPEKIKVKKEMLSPYSRENAKKIDIKTGTINKLVPNLIAKEKYVVHFKLNNAVYRKLWKI